MTKRVAPAEGDSIRITDGSAYLNNKRGEEDYILRKSPYELKKLRVTKGKIFVMGDDRTESTHSRNETVGLADEEDILGKVVFTW